MENYQEEIDKLNKILRVKVREIIELKKENDNLKDEVEKWKELADRNENICLDLRERLEAYDAK